MVAGSNPAGPTFLYSDGIANTLLMPRTAIISDIHANMHALSAVMGDVQQQLCNDVACLGDIVGYNAYPAECLDYIRSLNCPAVKGNHDEEVVRESYVNMNPMAMQAMQWTRSRLNEDQLTWLARLPFKSFVRSAFSMVHASSDQPQKWNYILNASDASSNFGKQFSPVCFHGHTHVPKIFYFDGQSAHDDTETLKPLNELGEVSFSPIQGMKYFINVGSVGQPRDGDPRSCYVIYDTDQNTITFRRVAYDIAGAQAAVRAVGLPEYLAERLERGV